MDKPSVSQTAELLRLRGVMQAISQISFSYSVLNKRYSFDQMTTSQADELIFEYKKLVDKTLSIIEAENYGQQNTTT